ncbi:hypothetical protein F5Y13DRAFT_55677 [Hypoxylon sp. FL1857]|nr:hypothetical protein F5Y13DRAFT_55677 [Hypoxylon sp. FL1857]
MVWKSKSAPQIEAKASTFRYNSPVPYLMPSHHPFVPSANISAIASPRLSQVLPLLILLVFVAGAAFVGYQIYLSVTKIRDNVDKRMAKKNVVFTKDGLRVGVKHVEQENYVDATQSWVVKAWNMGSHNPPPVKRR